MSARWVVVENTPGYLPENDDPPVFDSLDEAKAYLRGEVKRLADDIADAYCGERDAKRPSVNWWDNDDGALVTDPNREHDLGRVVEILPVEGS